MKKKIGSMVLIGLTSFAGIVTYPLQAHAGMAELAELLRSPVGRFVMLDTKSGAELLGKIMGSEVGSALKMDEVIARLGSEELAPIAQELEGRLSRVRERFQIQASSYPSVPATDILGSLSAEELAVKLSEGGGVEFFPTRSGHTFNMERQAFLEGAEKHPGRMAAGDLSGRIFPPGAKLPGADLRFADMEDMEAPEAMMAEAQLESANLTNARLQEAVLKGADLRRAILTGAKLRGANLRGAKLMGADLRGTQLDGADLTGADLRGADLSTAHMRDLGFHLGVGAKLKGALFDADTLLPFSKEQAIKLGMTFMPS